MTKKKQQKFIKNEEGQAVIEMAYVMPLFFLLVFAIIDFGWLFYNQISVENAARNAARIACVEYTDIAVNDDPDNTINTAAFVTVDTASAKAEDDRNPTEQLAVDMAKGLDKTMKNVSMKVTYSNDTVTRINYTPTAPDRINGDVKVVVKCDMPVLTPVLGAFSDNMTRTLSSSSTYKVERSNASSGL